MMSLGRCLILTALLAAVAVPSAEGASKRASAKNSEAAASALAQSRHALALGRVLSGNPKSAASILKTFLASPEAAKVAGDERDRMYLTLGRALYQAGDHSGSIEAYAQVRKGGPSWLESLEERAYAHMRMGEPEAALAQLKTVLSPLFKSKVKAEPYYLASLAHLRVCDYSSVFKTLTLFKERFRGQVKTWETTQDSESKRNLRETGEIIQKMNLVEAEAIQRLYLDESGKRMGGSVPQIKKNPGQLSFPEVGGEEVWLDEVDDFKVSTKGCPSSGSSNGIM